MKIAVIGGGVAGLFTAWYLAQAGVEVTLYEKDKVGKGTTWWAAGMLAPINELEFTELELLRAGLKSRELYEEVGKALGDIGLERAGTLEVALNQDDTLNLRRLFDFQKAQGLQVEWLSGAAARELEPMLAHHIPNAIWSPNDIQVDNRKLVAALEHALRIMKVEILENAAVQRVYTHEGQAVETASDTRIFDKVVWATGVAGVPDKKTPFALYPVRGELVELKPPAFPFLKKTVRIWNKVLGRAYIVPKSDRIVIGATSEEKGMNRTNTAGGLLDILRKGYAAVPGIYELEVKQVNAGLRPATLSRHPVIDQEPGTEVYHVNGLYRHGILLGPLAGSAAAQLMLKGTRMPEIENFKS